MTDWLRQLELLPRERPDARACVWLRLANYERALDELEPALERSAADPYLQLYYLMAARLLRVSVQPGFSVTDVWPGPLIALHQGGTHRREGVAACRHAGASRRSPVPAWGLCLWR